MRVVRYRVQAEDGQVAVLLGQVRRRDGAVHRSRGGEAVQGHGAGRGGRVQVRRRAPRVRRRVRRRRRFGVRRLRLRQRRLRLLILRLSVGRLRHREGQQGGQGQPQAQETSQEGRGGESLRPVEEDPRCTAVLQLLDRQCVVISGPGPAMDEAVARCAACDVVAVDCEGVNMSRVGAITLLQVAAGDSAYLFDAGHGPCVLRDGVRRVRHERPEPQVGPRGSRCREARSTAGSTPTRSSQHGVSLTNVFDVQLADVAARRRNHHAVSLLSGMPKCAGRWLPKGPNQAEAALAAQGLDRAPIRSDADAPPDAASVARVTEHLKRKVKEQYASNLGGDGELWAKRPLAEDVRRYAALDAWLLKEIYAAMEHANVLDEDWRARVVKESERRVGGVQGSGGADHAVQVPGARAGAGPVRGGRASAALSLLRLS